MEEQRHFYGARLALPITDEPGGFSVSVGDSRLRFREGQAPIYHLAFNVAPDGLESAASWISSVTPLLVDADGQSRQTFESWQARSIYFKDADDNVMECIARQRLTEFAGRTGLLSISEVGLPTEAVLESARRLMRELDAPVFGELSPGFTTLGDDHGLLLLPAAGRPWVPERVVQARPVPMRVLLQQGKKQHWLESPGGSLTA